MNLTIHRGSKEIGGTCVELETSNSRILIDIGAPLPDPEAAPKNPVPPSLAASLRRKDLPITAILISHPHQDHYGLLDKISSDIPVYTGKAAKELIKLSFEIQGKHQFPFHPITYERNKPFRVGDFEVTPYLIDHSGFDSYAFLVKCEGKKILYSGDFRDHGIKHYSLAKMVRSVKEVDTLLMEGTLVGQERAEAVMSEDHLRVKFAAVMRQTKRPVFITMSGMNIDRLCVLMKACNNTNRILAIDPYVAEILDRLSKVEYAPGKFFKLPHPSWAKISVCYPRDICKWLKAFGNDCIRKRYLKYGKKWQFFKDNAEKLVIFAKPSYAHEILGEYYFDLSSSSWIYSMWSGYLTRDKKMEAFKQSMLERGVSFYEIHTSGHASLEAMKKLADGVSYSHLIPIHTNAPETFKELFRKVKILRDGEVFSI